MQFRIAQISDDASGVLTGAFVFSPPPHLPDTPRVLVERFGAENTKLGRHGWAVDSKGLRPRVVEKRGMELWLCFGAEVSFHVLPNTPVRISIPGTELEGTEIWPPIPRGKAPPADIPEDDAPWPEPAPPRKEAPRAEEATVIVAPPRREEPRSEEPPPRREEPPAPPPREEEPPPPVRVDPPPPPPKRGSPLPLLIAVVLLLLAAAGGTAWWLLQPPGPQQAEVTPPAPPPPPAPAEPDCAEPADVLSGKCSTEKLRALPPGEQTRLAEGLLRLQGDRRAGDMAVILLGTAANANHPQARLALGRLYDPIGFREGGPLRAANPERALDEYGRAADAGLAEARTARDALVARLKQDAAGADTAAAERARSALRAAGIE